MELKKTAFRAAGFGSGFAIVCIIIMAVSAWWMNRPKHWSTKAITAKYNALSEKNQGGADSNNDEIQLTFEYLFQNNTNDEYILPSPINGALMRNVPTTSSVDKLENVTWDSTVRIPPRQSVDEKFIVTIKLADYSTSWSELNPDPPADGSIPPKLLAFLNRRMAEMNGLVFYDYSNKYRIEMPNGWVNAMK